MLRSGEPTPTDRIELAPGALSGWNVLLVSMDTVRRDRLHCYGRQEIETPIADALARRGIRFDQAVTPVPMTLPGHATMLTGLTPPNHGARVNGMFYLDEKVATLGGTLRTHGYRAGGFIAAFVLDRQFGLGRGFDLYDDDLSGGRRTFGFSYRERPAEKVNESAIAWLKKDLSKPFFMFVHYFDPHWPYDAPEPFQSKYKDNDHGGYDAEIAYTDQQLGKLLGVLDELGVRDRTLVILTSDHGEGLEEHNESTHSMLVYDTTLRVPLIFSGPAPVPHHRLVTRQVGLIDLMPTILDLLGLEIPSGLDGLSLLRPPDPGPRRLYIETLGSKFLHGWAPLVGVRRDDYKFVLAPQCELFDLRADPKELNNLFEADRVTASMLHEELKAMIGGDPELVTEATANLPMDEATRQKLADLGYVVTTTAPTTSATTQRKPLPDPKEMIQAQRWVLQAQTLIQQGQDREALHLLEPYLEKHPDDALALHAVGEAYQHLAMLEQSVAAFRRATRMPFERGSAFARMGAGLMLLGKLDEAEDACRQALAVDAYCPNALLTLGWVRAKQDRDDEAMAYFQKVVKEGRGSSDAPAYLSIGKFYFERGKTAEAREAFEKGLAIDPNHRGIIAALAKLADTEKDKDAVMTRLRKAIQANPNPALLLELGQLEAEKGQFNQAARTLREALSMQSDNPKIHLELARVLQKLNRRDEALTNLREAVRHNPQSATAQTELGLALARRKRFEEARRHLGRAAALTPRSAIRRYNYGLVLAKLSQWSEAALQFRDAVKLQPDYAPAHYNLAQVLQIQGHAEDAAKHLRRAIELDPNMAQAGK